MSRLRAAVLFCAFLLLVTWLPPAPLLAATADAPAITSALDLAADGKVKKARKALESADAGDAATMMLTELFAAYTTKDSGEILQHFWRAEAQARRVDANRFDALLERVRSRAASGDLDDDAPLQELVCHLRTLHPSPPAEAAPADGDPDASGKVRAPRMRFEFNPPFPVELGNAGGVVVTQAEIDTAGCVVARKTVKSFSPIAAKRVLDAARWYVFEPAGLGGEPVAVYYNFTSNFVPGR